jgi:chaperonin cofactor prefoldin
MDEGTTFVKIIDDITGEYTRAIKDLNDFSETLLERVESLTQEMAESRKLIEELENKIFRHFHTD